KAISQFVADAHAAGVRHVVPYISPITMFGDADARLGFFEFYDRWGEYERAFQLGPRPAGDPVSWAQQDPEGDVAFTMGEKQKLGSMRRYSMCVNNPGWRQWQMIVARWAARAGYDGLFMDNVLVHRCYCRYCEAVARELGVSLKDDRGRKLTWVESYLRYFDDLRREGERERRGFYLAGNYIELPFQRPVTDRLDLSMVEKVWLGSPRLLWPGGIWTGFYPPAQRTLNNRTRGNEEAQSLNNIWLAQLSYAVRGSRGAHLLYGGQAANRGPEFAHNEESATLALAEGAAFGGGVSVTVVSGSPFIKETNLPAHDARRAFHAFARQRRQLFEGLLPAGDVALLVFTDRLEIESVLEAQQVHESLLWGGALVDVLDGETASEQQLARYKLVVVAGRPELPGWLRSLPQLVRSEDPIAESEVRAVKRNYQRERAVEALRRTGLSAAVARRAAQLRAVNAPAGSLVQAAAWGDERRTVLHLLNFKVPIGHEAGGAARPAGDISVRLPLPAGKRPRRVEFHSPEAASAPVRFQEEKGAIVFRPPAFRAYGVCEVVY
ncbi:MAG TPA: hypothetical protein VD968_12700, partial [Pyrinomonadaceae bacterium]|nr:hypothetical protein [Pyrinomonadaceae bacterium]